MKRIFNIITSCLCTFALCATLVIPAHAAIAGNDYIGSTTVTERGLTITQAPSSACTNGILCSSDGTVLWSRAANKHHAMASITKMMTAIVVLDSGIDISSTTTISANASSVGESTTDLHKGYVVSIYDLLCGLLVHSGNDAGVALAEAVSGNVESFVAKMNEKAKSLGLSNTHFTNPHGLDSPDHYSSAYDLCVLQRYCMKNKTFKKIVGKKKVTVTYSGKKRTFHSTNSLMNSWSACKGTKTGYTNNAGYCLASMAKRDGVELYCVVLGCNDESERFTDSYKLLEWGFNHYRNTLLAQGNTTLVDAPMSGFLNKTVAAGLSQDYYGMVLDYDGDVSVDISLKDISGGISKGDEVGVITFKQGDSVIGSAPLVALETKFPPLAITSIWTCAVRLIGCFTGDDAVADSVSHIQEIEITRNDDLSGEEVQESMEKSIRNDAMKNG